MQPTLRWFLLLILVPILALAGVVKHVKHEYWTAEYDAHFRKYTKHYFGPHIDWHWFKAQGIAESGLNPKANSSVGAVGIMQILPATYAEIKQKNPYFTHIEVPRWNIAAGIFYDSMLYRKWKKGLPTEQRLTFALASYNAGYGTINRAFHKAQKRYKDIKDRLQVVPYAPGQTGHYIQRINDLMAIEY